MRVIFNRFISSASLVCIFLSFINIANATNKFDIDFYNVGQGHCCVASTQKNGIIIIDAGSSSTMGVDEVTHKKNKNNQLATHIFDSVKNSIKTLGKLNFIITHADKDHLNLAEPIVRMVIKDNLLKKRNIQFILGGEENDYTSSVSGKEAKELIDFLKKNKKISYAYGTDFIQNNLLWNPPPHISLQFSDDEDIRFLSVKREKKYDPSNNDETNASSIVVRLKGGRKSVMITGDKTRREIVSLIKKYKKNGEEEKLKSFVLLSTHHGSEEDFSEELMEVVQPSFLVVSSGTSSFFHPRPKAVCSDLVLKNIKKITGVRWHPIRSYGDISSISENYLSHLVPICSGENNNFRNTPYSYSMTTLGIYVTADQGTVKFSFNNGNTTVKHTKTIGDHDFSKAIHNFLTSKSCEWSVIKIPKITLSKELCQIISVCSSLRSLDLSHIPMKDKDTDNIITVIKTLTSLTTLNIKTDVMKKENIQKIYESWGYRGLKIK